MIMIVMIMIMVRCPTSNLSTSTSLRYKSAAIHLARQATLCVTCVFRRLSV